MKTAYPHSDINTPNYYAKLQNLHVICYDVNYITKFSLCNLLFVARKDASRMSGSRLKIIQ